MKKITFLLISDGGGGGGGGSGGGGEWVLKPTETGLIYSNTL